MFTHVPTHIQALKQQLEKVGSQSGTTPQAIEPQLSPNTAPTASSSAGTPIMTIGQTGPTTCGAVELSPLTPFALSPAVAAQAPGANLGSLSRETVNTVNTYVSPAPMEISGASPRRPGTMVRRQYASCVMRHACYVVSLVVLWIVACWHAGSTTAVTTRHAQMSSMQCTFVFLIFCRRQW
jgi:hypothetical protein